MKKIYLKETLLSDLLRNTAVNHFMRHLIYQNKQIQSNDKKVEKTQIYFFFLRRFKLLFYLPSL
jgi:hypothetical protein